MTKKIFAALLFITIIAGSAFAMDVKLGDFTVKAPDSFFNGEVAEAERAKGLIAYYKSNETMMDFDVFEAAKDDNNSLADLVKAYAGENTVTESEINGIKVLSYRSTDVYGGKTYNVVWYFMEGESKFSALRFWLDGENAESEVKAVIDSLSK